MKFRIFFATCFLVLLAAFLLVSLRAQQPQSTSMPSSAGSVSPGAFPSPDQVVSRMNSRLNLSDDQKAKITPIIADRQAQLRSLMSNTSEGRFQKARQMKSILSSSDEKIEGLLTGDQVKIYKQMEQQRREDVRSQMQ